MQVAHPTISVLAIMPFTMVMENCVKPAVFSNNALRYSALAPTVALHTAAPGAHAPSIYNSFFKRAFDIAFALAALTAALPFLVLIGLLVKADSDGPVLFRQRRSGLGGRTFTIYKFRTMRVMENGYTVKQAGRDDARITRFGGFLRKSSLDELPQLLNVLVGDMSVVGPRPHAVAHDMFYGSIIDDYDRRFVAKPGITGLAQVRGQRGECSDVECMRNRVRSDVEYVANWSFFGDVGIVLRTIPALLRHSAY